MRAAFRTLSTVDTQDVSLVAAMKTLGADRYETETLLEDLVDYHLMETGPEPVDEVRYRFLPSLRAVGHRLHAEEDLMPAQAGPRVVVGSPAGLAGVPR